MAFTLPGSTVWRDYATDGVPASGAHQPTKAQIRQWAQEAENRSQGKTEALQVEESGTALTLSSTHLGYTIITTGSSGVTITIPADLGDAFHCSVIQLGSGQVTFAAASGATLRNYDSHTKTAGQYARVELEVVSNADNASAVAVLSGRTGA